MILCNKGGGGCVSVICGVSVSVGGGGVDGGSVSVSGGVGVVGSVSVSVSIGGIGVGGVGGVVSVSGRLQNMQGNKQPKINFGRQQTENKRRGS